MVTDTKKTKREVLIEPAEKQDLYHAAMTQLIDNDKKILENINHNILLAKNTLKLTNESIVKEKNNFEIWKRVEKSKFDQELFDKRAELDKKLHAVIVNEKNIIKRQNELVSAESKVVALEREREEVSRARIDVEKLRIKTSEALESAIKKSSDAESLIRRYNDLLNETKSVKNKYDVLNIELSNREAQVSEKLKQIKAIENNLVQLKGEIDPKLKILEDKERNVLSVNKDTQEKLAEIDSKIEEDRKLMKAIEEKNNSLKAKERDILTREENLKRLALLKDAAK